MSKKVVATPKEVPAEAKAEQVVKTAQVRDMYCLLINDQVQLETGMPVGNWFCMYMNFHSLEFHGPYPLLATTRTGQAPFSGFVAMESLRAAAEYLWGQLVANPEEMGHPIPLNMVSGSNKMMSCWIASVPD